MNKPVLSESHYSSDSAKIALRTFWITYQKNIDIYDNNNEIDNLLFRSTNYCALRLIQTAFESLYNSDEITNTSIFLLQLSINILKDNAKAIEDLFGIRN